MDSSMEQLKRLQEITRILRSPEGCEWDRAQDFLSMKPHLIEEAYEVVDALERADIENLREELGDLLFLVFFFTRLAEEKGHFSILDVAEGVSEKLIRRHPHVFGNEKVDGVADILGNWERIKKAEKAGKADASARGASDQRKSHLDGVAPTLPALFRAHKVQEKAARIGFDWSDAGGVLAKIREEAEELRAAMAEREEARARAGQRDGNRGEEEDSLPAAGIAEAHDFAGDAVEDELGDLLFTVVNLSRHLGYNAELALKRGTDKFVRRFRRMEEEAEKGGVSLDTLAADKMEELWNGVKRSE